MYKIRAYKQSDWEQVAKLVQKSYKKGVAPYGTDQANQMYLEWFDPEAGRAEEFFKNKQQIRLVAEKNNKIIGVLRAAPDHLHNIFVDINTQGKGIGSALMKRYFTLAKQKGVKSIKLRAVINAIPFYQKLGFKKTTGVRPFHGIQVQPMKKEL